MVRGLPRQAAGRHPSRDHTSLNLDTSTGAKMGVPAPQAQAMLFFFMILWMSTASSGLEGHFSHLLSQEQQTRKGTQSSTVSAGGSGEGSSSQQHGQCTTVQTEHKNPAGKKKTLLSALPEFWCSCSGFLAG